eukprot:6204423-Pleurochrysis_carterae.AAC.3
MRRPPYDIATGFPSLPHLEFAGQTLPRSKGERRRDDLQRKDSVGQILPNHPTVREDTAEYARGLLTVLSVDDAATMSIRPSRSMSAPTAHRAPIACASPGILMRSRARADRVI